MRKKENEPKNQWGQSSLLDQHRKNENGSGGAHGWVRKRPSAFSSLALHQEMKSNPVVHDKHRIEKERNHREKKKEGNQRSGANMGNIN